MVLMKLICVFKKDGYREHVTNLTFETVFKSFLHYNTLEGEKHSKHLLNLN